ncbi:hypothetical protein [Halobacterium rubrum]|uniref:hypothetical protein n=1 Tax=Halobacterium TaxID=2239 RepID=UPI001F27955D|nr:MULTISPECIES: hypothetical protein [Halobacterium]MDH5020515.1 hypothetical protein [Halobacterium rubrum]
MRHIVLLVAALVVVGAGAPTVVASPAAPADAVGGSDDTGQVAQTADDDDGNETANGTAPGARLAGVVNVQGAEVEGEVAERSFGLQLAAATSNASKASVLANQTGDLSERVAELRDRKQALRDARANGTISEGRYRAEMARVAAELSTANRLLNRTSSEATKLPAAALQNAGVNATDLQRLREAAGNVSGPEMAAIARDIGGPPVNRSVGPPGNRTTGAPGNSNIGPPGNDTQGPPANRTQGPSQNETRGPPGNSTQGPPGNTTQGPPADGTDGPTQNGTEGPPSDTPGTPGSPNGTGANVTTSLLDSLFFLVTS